jgi:hypothetical protein
MEDTRGAVVRLFEVPWKVQSGGLLFGKVEEVLPMISARLLATRAVQ